MTECVVREELGELLSPSQVSTYLTCPAKWYFRYLVGLTEPATGALALGKAFHATLATNFRRKLASGHDLEPVEVHEVFEQEWILASDDAELRDDEDAIELATTGETRSELTDPATKFYPLLVGRNLFVLLENEPVSGGEKLDRALRPYWSALWRLAARGHYYIEHKPVREKPKSIEERFNKETIPPIHEGGFTLSFAHGEGNDFSLLISFPGVRAPQYPLGQYVVLAEFRRMLTALDAEGSQKYWTGEYFFGFVMYSGEEAELSFRARDNGITMTLTGKEWRALRDLFRRAWDIPDVHMMWDGLLLEYGEL